MKANNSAPATAAAERLTVVRGFMLLAGTNIEDFDRAMRKCAAAYTLPALAIDPVEPEVTA